MPNSEKYNGFSNKETYTVYHYIKQESYLYEKTMRIITLNRNQAAEAIQEYFQEMADLVLSRQADDKTVMIILDIGSLWRVKYREIVKALSKT